MQPLALLDYDSAASRTAVCVLVKQCEAEIERDWQQTGKEGMSLRPWALCAAPGHSRTTTLGV